VRKRSFELNNIWVNHDGASAAVLRTRSVVKSK